MSRELDCYSFKLYYFLPILALLLTAHCPVRVCAQFWGKLPIQSSSTLVWFGGPSVRWNLALPLFSPILIFLTGSISIDLYPLGVNQRKEGCMAWFSLVDCTLVPFFQTWLGPILNRVDPGDSLVCSWRCGWLGPFLTDWTLLSVIPRV